MNAIDAVKVKRKKLTQPIGCLLLSSFLLIACIGTSLRLRYLSLYPSAGTFIADQTDKMDTAAAFAYSLAHNRTENMYSFVVVNKWGFIDTWPTTHTALPDSCRYPDDPDFWGFMYADGVGTDLWFEYTCPERVFFQVSLEMIHLNGKWFVNDWDKICEERGTKKQCW